MVCSPLKEKSKASEANFKAELKEVKYLLLLIFNTLTFVKVENSSTVFKVVSKTKMLFTFCQCVTKSETVDKVVILMV